MVYGDGEQRLEPLPPPVVPRAEVIDELYEAVVERASRRCTAANGRMATLEVCLAMLRSAREAARGRCCEALAEGDSQGPPRAPRQGRNARAWCASCTLRLAEHGVSFGHWTFLRSCWEHAGLTQRELSDQAA